MKFTEIRSELLGESYYTAQHKSGVMICVYPQPEYSGAYAIFGTKCGSIDDNFRIAGEREFTRVPAGIAHFLEHKLFENEDCDAFQRYAETGANANAYTSFDRTCYLFSCTDNFEKSFEILLSFVQSPYFTEETVAKEQGIIGQEIRMYDDDPQWRVMFNLLDSMYHNHPIKLDIAGTTESISEITADVLYKCYNAFYHPSNMVITVAGNVTPEQVAAIADRCLRDESPISLERALPDEPADIVRPFFEQHFDVGIPMFQIGFKDAPEDLTIEQLRLTELLMHTIAGPSSSLYRSLMDKGLINSSFSMEYMYMPGAQAALFSGESKHPEEVRDALLAELDNIRRNGIDPETFECARRAMYGSFISMLANSEYLAGSLTELHFFGWNIFDGLQAVYSATVEQLQELLKTRLCPQRCSLSVVR